MVRSRSVWLNATKIENRTQLPLTGRSTYPNQSQASIASFPSGESL